MDKLIFLFAAFFLVWGLRLQSSPESAARGNKYAALGMFLSIFGAIIMPFENSGFNNYLWIFLPLTASSIIGYGIAKKIKMTSMPQMVSIFNGLGGLSAVLLSFIELYKTSFLGGESS